VIIDEQHSRAIERRTAYERLPYDGARPCRTRARALALPIGLLLSVPSIVPRHMVARYGMTEALGLAAFEPPRQELFLNVPPIAQREYSEETAPRIDDEVRKLLETSDRRVRRALTARREVLTSWPSC
jgi:hypothetical protein